MPDLPPTPFELIGGEGPIRALVNRFYDIVSEHEPALARLHPCDANGRIDGPSRERFSLFMIGWLGGPQEYTAIYGLPRLHMRHMHVPVTSTHRDAWLRSMQRAFDEENINGEVREYLDRRLADVADMLRNVQE